MSRLNPGLMRHVVRIEQRSSTPDGSGEPTLDWILVAQRRAELVRTPGRELWASSERQGRVPTLFRLRFSADLDVLPQMRLVCNSKVYDVLSAIDPDGMGAELIITTEEHVEETL